MQSLLVNVRAGWLGINFQRMSAKVSTVAACLQAKKAEVQETDADAEAEKQENPEKKSKSSSKKNVDVSICRLDIRIGKIVRAKKHPNADSLYVEVIDIGKGEKRTAISGLVNHISLKELENRLVVMISNMKVSKMRGINSEAMVLCAHSPDKIELLAPPPGSAVGDLVQCSGFTGEPDKEAKKKLFDQVQVDLKVDGECTATYKDVPLEVAGGKGAVKAPSLCNVPIK